MKNLGLAAAVAASVAVTGCATNPYGSTGYDPYYNNTPYGNQSAGRAATGAAAGGVAGAIAGAGVSTS